MKTENEFDPWTLFLNDPQVKRRIEGFKHIRGTLCIRAMITGNPMYAGRYMLFYRPRELDCIPDLASPFGDARLIQASQHMHIMLDPGTGEGGEMHLPFFCPENWIDLTSTRSVTTMGRLNLFTPVALTAANSASASCYIKILAWMENVELAGPTATAYGSWTPQSSEFGKHPISTVASAVAKGAGLLARVPQLEPYALATQTAAGLVGTLASAFGFSRPQVLSNPSRFREMLMGEMATTNTHELVHRLGLDCKGELTVDPRTVGLPPVDEMSFDHIVQKDNIIKVSQWDTGDATGSAIDTFKVTPCQFGTDTTTINNRSALTSQAAVAVQFRYWRGTIIYRFRIVASAMHRGRLRITYDPVATGTSDFNEVYSHIVDIEETRDFEIPVAWHANTSFLRVNPPDVGSTNFNHGSSITHLPTFENGALRIEVLNPLGTPDPTLNVGASIIVSQRMTDDYEFGFPYNFPIANNWRFFSAAAEGMQGGDAEATDEPSDPSSATVATEPMGTTQIPDEDHTMKVFMGESPRSCRTLMRRYNYKYIALAVNSFTFQTRGKTKNVDQKLDVMEWFTWQYIGWRGSIRIKMLGDLKTPAIVFPLTGTSTVSNADQNGAATFINDQAVEVEVPFYSNKRFAVARGNTEYTDYTADQYDALDPNRQHLYTSTLAVTNRRYYKAAGEDYALFWHVGLPLIYPEP